MKQPEHRQLPFVFADNSKETARGECMDASMHETRAEPTANDSQRSELATSPADDTSRLLERIAAPGNLAAALGKVVSNKGAPGVDRQSVQEVKRHAILLTRKLRDALLSETYVPGDIRRVWIPKSEGGQRGLGIPNVVDRWVQQAFLQELEPVYDPTFHKSSHGFRPGRGCHTAIEQSVEYVVTRGLRYTVDIDLASFFDRVNHQRLLDRLAQRIGDRRVLRVIRLMLKAKVVHPDGSRVATEEGTPQGGPLSPLLSNIVLDELDWELERRGLQFVRYADDCNIYVRSQRAGERVMASTRRFIEGRLRLKVNEAKSAVDLAIRRHFLGFRVGESTPGYPKIHLSSRSFKRIHARIGELTPRNWGSSLAECMERLEIYLRGWMGYFRLVTGDALRTLRTIDAHIRRRLRAIIVRQKKRPRHLFRHLVEHGVSRGSAARAAFSRRGIWWISRSSGMHTAYPNAWFAARLPTLADRWRQTHHDWRPQLTGTSR